MKKKKKKYKYKIITFLKKRPYDEYLFARKNLPIILEVSDSTFERWLNIPENSDQDIPSSKLAIIAKYCQCKMEDLFNFKIPQITRKNFEKAINIKVAAKRLGLTK